MVSFGAIGTGKTSPDQVEEVHKYIRGIIKDRYNESLTINCSILYGGSYATLLIHESYFLKKY